MASSSQSRSSGCRIVGIFLILILLILAALWWLWQRRRDTEPEPADPVTAAQFASGWSVKNNADWTPFPPNANPLGPPNDACTGGTIRNSWAEFTFSGFGLPAGATVTGIQVRVKYLSQSGTNTLQLTGGGALIGATRTVASVAGQSSCANTQFTGVGGDGELWATSLTAADFNAGTIGVRLTQDANTVDLDAIELSVFFTP